MSLRMSKIFFFTCIPFFTSRKNQFIFYYQSFILWVRKLKLRIMQLVPDYTVIGRNETWLQVYLTNILPCGKPETKIVHELLCLILMSLRYNHALYIGKHGGLKKLICPANERSNPGLYCS